MTISKDTDFTDDAGFLEIEKLVKDAKKFEEESQYDIAKSKYLDAASKAIDISKKTHGMEKLTYENICRALIEHAKEVKLLLKMEITPLPRVPTKLNKAKAKTSHKSEMKMTSKPQIQQFLIIKETGTPIYSCTNSSLSPEKKEKLNEILFSGALTAVNHLMQEVIQKPIQNIQFDEGNIVIKSFSNMIFVVYSDMHIDLIESPFKILIAKFLDNIYPEHENKIKRGAMLTDNKELTLLVNQYFKV